MAIVIYSDLEEFLADLEADARSKRVDDDILRVSIKQRVGAPYIFLSVMASYEAGFEICQLRRPLPDCKQGDADGWMQVRQQAGELVEVLRRKARELGLQLRGGGHRAESEF